MTEYLLTLDRMKPAVYFPLTRGRFTVAPGLQPLTTSFGNGAVDHCLFQIDREFARFRANTISARAERWTKYLGVDPEFATIAPEACALIVARLITEYPAFFELVEGEGGTMLNCRLTQECLCFDRNGHLIAVESPVPIIPAYRNGFDALLSQVPEDMAIVGLADGKADRNVALHITAPSHWIPEEKIGQSFLQTHAPVPHFERIAQASGSLLESLHTRPPFVRFNWGIEFTDRLNLHPEPPIGNDPEEWNRRTRRASDLPPVYLRVERQVLWGMRSAHAQLFAIRIYLRPLTALTAAEREALQRTLHSMPSETRVYKGLAPDTFNEIMQYLHHSTGTI